MVKEMQQSLLESKAHVQRLDERATDAEASLERATRELNSLRKRSKDSIQLKAENDNLSRLLVELKRSSSFSDSEQQRLAMKDQQHRRSPAASVASVPHTQVLLEKQVLSK